MPSVLVGRMEILLVGVLAVACAAAPDGADPGLELLVTSAGPATSRTCYPTRELPRFLKGTYLVAGPAKFEVGEYRYQAIFDGLGKMNRFEIEEGKVCYTSAWMETGTYQSAMREGRPGRGLLFEETQPPRPPCFTPLCNVRGPNDNNWVNVIPVGDDQVLLLTDSPQMLSMDLETLKISGRKVWSNDKGSALAPPSPEWLGGLHAAPTGSAHPLRIPGTRTWVDVIGEMPILLGHNWMDVYTFDGSQSGPQPRVKIGSIRTKDTQYIHSFGVTQNHVVLIFDLQMKVNPLHFDQVLGAIQGDTQGIHVMDFGGRWRSFETEPFFHVHTINTFENASGIVMDLGLYKELPFAKSPQLDMALFLNKTARDTNPVRSGVRRLHLHTSGWRSGSVTFEDLVPIARQVDFFRINPAYEGLPYCVYYATEWWHDDRSYASEAVLKHNVCTGEKQYWHREGTYVGEPMFVASGAEGAREDDGVVVFVALFGESRRSRFVTLDARSMALLESVELPGHIPFTAHGHFIPARPRPAATGTAAAGPAGAPAIVV
uniref:Uncharacterized protein n=1 Tax=Alexandrium catenella TaxID=2925 RepID=A0A7S1LN72_ALECA